MTEGDNKHLQQAAMADLLLLQQRLRAASGLCDLGHVLVNDTRKLIFYRTSILWLTGKSKGKVAAVSGIPQMVKDAPFTVWVRQLCRCVAKKAGSEIYLFSVKDVPGEIGSDWNEYLPAHAIWLPLVSPAGDRLGGLLLTSEKSWRNEETSFLKYWADTASYSINYLSRQKPRWLSALPSLRLTRVVVAVLALAALWLPLRLSALAPAEVVPGEPMVVRAPLDGVIDKVMVRPNQTVTKDMLLLRLDDTALRARFDVVQQELEIAKAEYRRAEQASVTDRAASAQIPLLKSRIDQRTAEAAYVRSLLDRIAIHAEMDGVAILPDSHELEGRPVKIGERIMVLANPAAAELEAWLAVGDSIPFSKGAQTDLFLNVAPETPYAARLRYVNYQAEISSQGILAFRVRADFSPSDTLPRIGRRGVAKIYSHKVPLYYYLFHRPYAALRQWLGL